MSLIGFLLGGILGPISLPYLFYEPLKTTYTMPIWKPVYSTEFLMMSLVATLICTLATYVACKNNLKDTPSQSLRPKVVKVGKSSYIEKTKIWSKLGFNFQWNFRDIFRSKVRSIMAIVGVLGCSALVVCALGMNDSLQDIIVWQYEDINLFESKINLDKDISHEYRKNIENKYEAEGILEDFIEIKANNIKKTGNLTVKDNVSLIRETNEYREFIELPNDKISLSYKMAKSLGVKVGDNIEWHIYNDEKWIKSEVGEIYRDPTTQGIKMSKELYEKLGYEYRETAYLTSKSVDEKVKGAESISTKLDLRESYDKMTEGMNIMIYVLIIAAVLLAVVVLYNLGVLSFTESERELSTLKVIGFKSKKIRRLLLTQNIWLTCIGIIVGIPLGKFLIDYIMSFMGDSLDMMTIIKTKSIIYSILFTFTLSIFVNLMFSKKVKK